MMQAYEDLPVVSLPAPLKPSAFADLSDAPPAEISPLVEQAAFEAEPATLKRATALILVRALRLLREGSREEILDEALAVSRGISGDAGRSLREKNPETFGAWSMLDGILEEAARRSDRAAVPSLLRGTHGPAVLELLAGEARPLPRAVIRKRLDLGEAHLSHLLRDLEEADLILRYRPKGSKEVFVELGPAGREVVSQSVLPPWLERLMEVLGQMAGGSPVEAGPLARELEEAGAPSRLAAERLSAALAGLAPAPVSASVLERKNVLAFRKEDQTRFEEVSDLPDGQSLRSLLASA
jgi:DNA-binding Lrp family transcriptional regulator